MKVDFKCKECGEISEQVYAVEDGPPKEVLCKNGHKMKRVWGTPSVQVPEWFGDDLTTSIAKRMANAPLPTGRDKVHY
jgi:predicted nucleic acid-binding Zn ribbon protein